MSDHANDEMIAALLQSLTIERPISVMQFDYREAIGQYADALKKNVDELTPLEKQMAVLNKVLNDA